MYAAWIHWWHPLLGFTKLSQHSNKVKVIVIELLLVSVSFCLHCTSMNLHPRVWLIRCNEVVHNMNILLWYGCSETNRLPVQKMDKHCKQACPNCSTSIVRVCPLPGHDIYKMEVLSPCLCAGHLLACNLCCPTFYITGVADKVVSGQLCYWWTF